MGYKWKPSKAKVAEFKKEMDELNEFLDKHPEISASRSMDSFYFEVNGQKYRISNHTVESSNDRAYSTEGIQVRDIYHPEGRKEDTIYIHASKTRLIEIFTAISNGLKVNGRGYVI